MNIMIAGEGYFPKYDSDSINILLSHRFLKGLTIITICKKSGIDYFGAG
jgi:hypothetical protein